ncbi:alpha/beta hydrolase [Rhodococcus sp. G-MC3]|uniref:alpha/beta fold hydrolase n=1 Tax=Rhodococcus sp. G-MC3 TaxID=3046209 RepID=UPI0024B91712|nr:alpha/beta hydrolase [Rhodococcus sp. G-MC3]MDJ0395041.1 alpha/beta hydrolase [Rhodococcus sp. G-MC3]
MTATASTVVDGLHLVRHQPRVPSAVTVLLLHGIGGSSQSCAPLAQELADRGIDAWCLDAAGYGESADPADNSHDFVADVLRVADAISPDKPLVLLGTSWGGVLALTTALARPDRVAGLVLADSTRGSGTSPEKAEAMRARARELARRGPDSVATERAPRLVAPGSDPAIVESVRTSMAALRIEGFGAAAEFMASTDHGPRLSDVTCPTLVLFGESDVVTGVDESRLLANRIPGATLHEIADAGHVAIQEQPAVAAGLVTDFLERLS